MPRPKKNGNGVDPRMIAGAVLQEVFAEFHRRGSPLGIEMMASLLAAVEKKIAELSTPSKTSEVTP